MSRGRTEDVGNGLLCGMAAVRFFTGHSKIGLKILVT